MDIFSIAKGVLLAITCKTQNPQLSRSEHPLSAMSQTPLLDQLALDLCPGDFSESAGTVSKCSGACKACRGAAASLVYHLATEARLRGLPLAGDWLDEVAGTPVQP